MSPLFHTGCVYRLSDLLGTRRPDAALRFVKIDARLLERQIAEFQNPSDLGFEILDDVLVLHSKHEARQYPVPVIHQFNVFPVVVPDQLEAVREFLPLAE